MEGGNGRDIQDLGQAYLIPHPNQAKPEHHLWNQSPSGASEEPCSSGAPEWNLSCFKEGALGWPVDAVCISPACFWSRQGHISAVLFTEIAPRCNHCVTAHLWNLAELQDVWGLCA